MGNTSIENILVQLTIFFIPFGVFSVETGVVNISLPNLFIISTIIYFSAFLCIKRELTLSKIQVLVFVLFCTALVTILITTFIQQGSPRRLITYIGYLLVTTILFLYINSISDAERVLRAAFLSAVAINALTIIHSVTYPVGFPFGQAYLGQRTVVGVTVPFQRTLGLPNITYGAFGMMSMVGTPYYLYKGIKNRCIITLFGVSLVLLGVLITQSRSTWVATSLAVFIVISGYVLKETRKKTKIAYVLAIVIPAIALVPSSIKSLISIKSSTFSSRTEQYRIALELLQSNPVTGVGLSNVNQFYSAYAIHSGFLRIGAEAGAFAFLTVVTVWAISLLFVSKGVFLSSAHYTIRVGVIAGIGAMIIEANMVPGFGKAPWILLATGLGIYSLN
ncbi:O-antigen ligase family protein [Halorubrum ezzemoulense]|uniref:O-antigen ligase family protein n=1 Tax=Halorubrum ezzemoulense TaxID=337243 RepID=UPI00232E0444|nr:O-antigen ligase family protein [Halorubrum ezzemoulense]MDB9253338.1 O-antigen ligase family protein [Halorubrum ezzemoulense]MDB9256297.1 O-antigen ligase family protein [Halorubrum ezzemoulense]MDB9277655.1 O-antigen ligase family protein [Halorubrum ezzemoulense]